MVRSTAGGVLQTFLPALTGTELQNNEQLGAYARQQRHTLNSPCAVSRARETRWAHAGLGAAKPCMGANLQLCTARQHHARMAPSEETPLHQAPAGCSVSCERLARPLMRSPERAASRPLARLACTDHRHPTAPPTRPTTCQGPAYVP